jgi:hypothetical protein
MTNNYFGSPAIGSSLLAACIARLEPLEICTDRATKEVKPTEFMEAGKVFEDLVEETYSGKEVFTDRYFKSDISKIPDYKGNRTDIRQILEILDIEDDEEMKAAVDDAYIYTGAGNLHGSYKQRHRCLDQIKAHDYRRPIPEPMWGKLWIMLERFGKYPFKIGDSRRPLNFWLKHEGIKIAFQVEHFWKHESGAECRAKFDMVWTWRSGADIWAMPLDIKATIDEIGGIKSFKVFLKNWSRIYVLQSKHYMEGFIVWCAENGCIPCPQIPYLVQESVEPYITHCKALSVRELDNLSTPYDGAIPQIWEWIEAGKPIKGYTDQQTVDRWGRPDYL